MLCFVFFPISFLYFLASMPLLGLRHETNSFLITSPFLKSLFKYNALLKDWIFLLLISPWVGFFIFTPSLS